MRKYFAHPNPRRVRQSDADKPELTGPQLALLRAVVREHGVRVDRCSRPLAALVRLGLVESNLYQNRYYATWAHATDAGRALVSNNGNIPPEVTP